MGQRTHPKPGWTNRLNFPHFSTTPYAKRKEERRGERREEDPNTNVRHYQANISPEIRCLGFLLTTSEVLIVNKQGMHIMPQMVSVL
jgi:hypothetical protein